MGWLAEQWRLLGDARELNRKYQGGWVISWHRAKAMQRARMKRVRVRREPGVKE